MPLIVISGCDGAGKSSLIKRIDDGDDVYGLAHWSSFTARLGLKADPADSIDTMNSMTRSYFVLLLNWGLREQIIEPMLAAGRTILCESYYLKFLAKERVYQRGDLNLIESLRKLPPPDALIDVRVPPEVAFRRIGGSINKYETLTGTDSQQDFEGLQVAMRDELDMIIRELQCPLLTIDGARPLGDSAEQARRWISDGYGLSR